MLALNRKLNWLFKEKMHRLSEVETEMDIINWEQRNADSALHETNGALESQRLEPELYQANQWADQDQREKINLFAE